MPIAQLDYPKAKLLMDIAAEDGPEKEWRIHACVKEPFTVGFIERAAAAHPGACFWDIGANVGPYTMVALVNGMRVIAIEPGYANYAAMCRNLALNNMLGGPVFALCGAVGAQAGFAWFEYTDLRPGAASHELSQNAAPRWGHHQQVFLQRMDDLMGLAEGPWYLKIDVDGFELDVLTGAATMLREESLKGIILEMNGATEKPCTDLLAASGWKLAERHAPRTGVCYGEFLRA